MELKNVTIGQILSEKLESMGDKNAIEYEDIFYTWQEIDEISDRVAIDFLNNGIEYKSHVAIWSINTINWIITYLALAKIGAISILINPNYKEQELIQIIKYSEVQYVCYGELNQKVSVSSLKEKSIGRVEKYIFIGKNKFSKDYDIQPLKELTSVDIERLQQAESKVTPKDIASMIFTSGTTSIPKGVLLNHYQLMNISIEATEQMKWTKEDKMCIALPLFHCFGLSVGFFASLYKGFCIYLLSGICTAYILKCIDQYKITVLNGVPTMFLALFHNPDRKKYNLSSLKSGIIAGSTIFKEDYLKIQQELNFEKLQQSYGQTEASPSITFNDYNDPIDIKAISVGKVISNVELKVIGIDDGHELKPYENGEIIIRGYNVMQGYYKIPKENSKKIKDEWLYTEDIGYLDNEGNLYITGRKQEIIIRSGENISPKEIENVIRNYPGILQVKVFGVPAPIIQEEIAACIVSENKNFELGKLREHLKKYLADYKVPKYICLFNKFPLNSNGKINIRQLKEDIKLKII
ncbi:class I adenylate-forming enzyme family protein [Clostridium beijerinckii]|uniref:Fatty-acyl-CoA synthase n=2 Tax=Clostridium beijerinckii TaxID=1520 RepID=A0A9Q5GJP0_CLOBE|nr:AMP-binding protein [Clostridium beijerinckii]AQS04687.1 long-chain-fatty-acid--CoA ligase [Clostridium beijerinckii]MBA2886864.1 fatty-acyl-CoA synthase [Clostridium beijerinckii]MBA2901880.1 fatty-acyl-CoA synthase [Clostridium beijerinckii]MBA2911579.1 fatty-acyl-CoA synthase [Clostridium beijerinckii]MBA9015755.1 fatty-acyl-CoA synthase [Clostridium beijerinckii]